MERDRAYWNEHGHRTACPVWGDEDQVESCTCRQEKGRKSTMESSSRADAARSMMRAAAAELAKIEAAEAHFGAEPPLGSVVTFDKMFEAGESGSIEAFVAMVDRSTRNPGASAVARSMLQRADRETLRRLLGDVRFAGYSYAALRTTGGWYLTGREQDARTWEELCDFIGADNAFRTILPASTRVIEPESTPDPS